MKKLTILTASLAALSLAYIQPASAADLFVDAQNPSASDASGCTLAVPCLTLNKALENSTANGSITILNVGVFGPIILTDSITINSPDGKSVISGSTSGPAGCIGLAPASCPAYNGYALEINATTSSNVKLKGLSLRQGSGAGGALKIGTANQVKFSDGNLRGSSTAAFPMLDIVPSNGNAGSGGQFQLVMSNVDAAYTGNTVPLIRVFPSGATSVRVLFDHVYVHNASAGMRIDASSISGAGNIVGAVSNSFFFSMQNAGVVVVAPSASNKATFGSVRSIFTNIGGQALRANGIGSIVAMSDDVVTGNNIGVQALNSGQIITFKNNSVAGNAFDTDLTTGGFVTQVTQF